MSQRRVGLVLPSGEMCKGQTKNQGASPCYQSGKLGFLEVLMLTYRAAARYDKDTYESDRNDQGGDDDIDRHQYIVKPAHGAIEVSHGIFDR